MKNKDDKKKDIDALRQDLARLRNLFVTGYEKLKVGQDFESRRALLGRMPVQHREDRRHHHVQDRGR